MKYFYFFMYYFIFLLDFNNRNLYFRMFFTDRDLNFKFCR